jgi:hypothetical protein
MKVTLYSLVCFLFFLTLSSKVSAQVPPDTARLSIGLDAGIPSGNITDQYVAMWGVSLRFDWPISRRSYITGEGGYNTFYLSNGSTTTQQAILNQPVPLLQTAPFKIGYKYFLFGKFYLQGQVGTTLLVNKGAEFATNGSPFTWSPGMGFVFKSKKHKRAFIDSGVRYEAVNSFYNDQNKYSYWAFHFSYGFML